MSDTSRPPRWVVVDDLDPSIVFEGSGWFTSNDARASIGNFGPTYLSTLHGTNSSAQLSFTFDGPAVKLWGSNNPRNRSGIIDPTWDCLVDGVNIGTPDPFPFGENNWVFCDWKDGTPGEHTLSVQVTTQGQTFWADRIEYIPSPGANVAGGSVISVDHKDNAIKFSQGWDVYAGISNFTRKQGATAEVEFVGTKLSWVGVTPDSFPRAPTTGAYTIDGGPATSFALPGLAPNRITAYNQKYFETPQLSPGPHRLLVVYQGNGETTPLTMTNILIEGGNFTSPLPGEPSLFAPGSSSSSAPSASTSAEGGKKAPIGAIVGGVVGGLAIVIATSIIAFLILRRRRTKDRGGEEHHVVPYDLPGDQAPSTQFMPMQQTMKTLAVGSAPAHSPPPTSFASTAPRSVPSSTTKGSTAGTSSSSAYQGQVPVFDARSQVSGGTGVVMHEDSGVRMDAEGNMIEVPPRYTAE